MAPRLVELASVYRGYMDRTLAISPAFAEPAQVAQSLKTGAAHEPQQLMRGAIVYGAIAALQDPAYVGAVRKYAADPDQRRQIAYEILKDPAYAVGVAGSASAAGLTIRALGDDAQRMYDQGKAVKQSAYDIQKAAWSKAEVTGREARLALAKQLSLTPALADSTEVARLTQASVGALPLSLTPSDVSPPYTPVVVRSLALAALAALGSADEASLEQIMPLLAETNGASCLNFAKMNLYQCLAVAKPNYEDVFCVGEHIMMDTGRCLLKSAGLAVPQEARYVPSADTGRAYVQPAKAPARKAPARKK